MTHFIYLPKQDGSTYKYELSQKEPLPEPSEGTFKSRVAYSAAHVVANPFGSDDPVKKPAIDWEQTMQYRHYLWSLGLSVAEAMDTAQRGMGLQWKHAKELITRSVKEAKSVGGKIASGAGTDHLEPRPNISLEDVVNAYEEQVSHVEGVGSKVILMASRALAACAKSPEDYEYVYGKILDQVSQPVILHWLGEMFDPNLSGYWGHHDSDKAMEVCLRIIEMHADKIEGIKISLLDDQKEIKMRRRLPESVRMYTGDDFNYPSLIEGDEQGYSHALLGIFDAIAPAASAALQELDQGDVKGFRETLDRTVPLARHIFQNPTYAYKTGVVFLAYLNGHQPHFRMIAGAESARSILHFTELFELADKANVLIDPEQAIARMHPVLQLAGVQQMEAVK
ncbi:dihydrodipicolinate synthase family protein [Halobacillus naozhouensis]|uniref:Dihydrodipicolinate synthase family protein n=1 Tax=Halobacillus naozhouensis TaxID=554880 RepID=A0ABY8IVL3_9BACI|nr:dihydrodipicolinate synthase family protein [Halobacillus naozhouensis]WFT74020.1 dihydrodipicolinate synthase family protein [Halobacillus naozhouensis]